MLQESKYPLGIKILTLLMLIALAFMCMTGLIMVVMYFKGIPIGGLNGIEDVLQYGLGLAKWLIFLQHTLLFVAVPLVFAYFFYKNECIQFLGFKWPSLADFLIFMGLLLCIYPLMAILTTWVSWIPLPEWMRNLDQNQFKALESLMQMNSLTDVLFNLLLFAVLPGIGEELLFRGVIQKELEKSLGKIHMAIWITSLVFALLHFQVVGFLPKLFIGLVLGYAYFYTKSIWVPMALHAINNGSATLALYFAGNSGFDVKENISYFTYGQLFLLVFFTALIGLYFRYIHHYYKVK
ncbi:MAG: type II CAAX endopeptidase family protein [Saprospiraceae bacterium]